MTVSNASRAYILNCRIVGSHARIGHCNNMVRFAHMFSYGMAYSASEQSQMETMVARFELVKRGVLS